MVILNLTLDLNLTLIAPFQYAINLNGTSSHSYTKVSLLKAYIVVHKFDLVYLSKIYLDSRTACDDDNLEISGYKLIRSDHLSNHKRGDVFIYYEELLPYENFEYSNSARMY